jgi:hypothetical protein
MNELAARNLNTLLDRAFEINNVPPAEQQGRRTLIALGRLSDPGAKLTAAQRQQLVSQIVQGIEPALPTITDPQLLMKQAVVLINQGVERDVNALEYWGENPRTQARLRPVVETVIKLLSRSGALARAQAEAIANSITAPNSPAITKYEEMERLAATAEYNQKMVEYYLALTLDKSSLPRRQVCDEAFNYLKQFDVDENPDRNIVRTRMAKLAMAKGDFAVARRYFDQVTESPTAERKNVNVQYEARYFAAVTELLAKNIAGARKHLDELMTWQTANLPQDPASQKGADAAATMLRYRIESLQGDLASDPTSKKQANEQAMAILIDLMSKRPELRGVIYEQLLPRMDETTELSKADPLLLRALMSKGEEELLRPPAEAPDAKIVERALAASREVLSRAQAGNLTDRSLRGSAALLAGFLLQKLNQPVEAATALLDYAQQFGGSEIKNANTALDAAQGLVGQLRSGPRRDEPEVVAIYEQFLPLAVNAPFGRTQFAFEYARRLQQSGDPAEAIRYFAIVPPTDARALDARYFELVARKQQLDDLATSTDRAAVLSEIQRLADEVNRAAAEALSKTPDDRRRNAYRLMLARTSLLAADLARREQKNPDRALKLLNNFDASVQGLAAADALSTDAMLVRVQSFMAAERYNEATQELVKLLNRTEGGQGAQIVYNLLEKLNADLDRAQTAGDTALMRGLAKNRAQLSGFLVDWAANSKDPGIRKFTYRYKVFDAETQRLAAVLAESDDARRAGLKTAADRFTALQSAENLALYKASLDPKSAADPELYDPQVVFGLARVQFDIGDWLVARDNFSRLIVQRKLGTATTPIQEDGQVRYTDNDAYWEAVLRLIQCNLKLGSGVEESKSFLKEQYITWGERVGGKKCKPQFDELRRQLIPEFSPPANPATNPSA